MIRTRMIVASLLAPLSAPLANFLSPILARGGEWPYNQTDFLMIMSISALFAYLALFFVGIPIYWILKRLRVLSILTLSVGGAASGALLFEIFFGLSSGFSFFGVMWGAFLGFLVAATFGLIAGVHNDKDELYAA